MVIWGGEDEFGYTAEIDGQRVSFRFFLPLSRQKADFICSRLFERFGKFKISGKAFEPVFDFENSIHPDEFQEAMDLILDKIKTGEDKGGIEDEREFLFWDFYHQQD